MARSWRLLLTACVWQIIGQKEQMNNIFDLTVLGIPALSLFAHMTLSHKCLHIPCFPVVDVDKGVVDVVMPAASCQFEYSGWK